MIAHHNNAFIADNLFGQPRASLGPAERSGRLRNASENELYSGPADYFGAWHRESTMPLGLLFDHNQMEISQHPAIAGR
jgi:hypothetical protein